jgi:hypothetical protein
MPSWLEEPAVDSAARGECCADLERPEAEAAAGEDAEAQGE